jgi:DtxR family Mn-dependent transcriptional regulator
MSVLTRGRRRRQRRIEDALKHLAGLDDALPATAKSLAGHLGLPLHRTVVLVGDMQLQGLVRMSGQEARLTERGQREAVRVVRAHRLIERYLADEMGEPLDALHDAAERREHTLTRDEVDALDALLGHPESDPHGDPIPDGGRAPTGEPGTPLADWPLGEPGVIRHIEDEPPTLLREILAQDLRPGDTVEVTARAADTLTVNDGVRFRELTLLAAAQVRVAPGRWRGEAPMSSLAEGEAAIVRRVDDQCRGAARRRLLDLGLTPGARVTCLFSAMFGEPVAYHIRGVAIALRVEQARAVWITRGAPPAEDARP